MISDIILNSDWEKVNNFPTIYVFQRILCPVLDLFASSFLAILYLLYKCYMHQDLPEDPTGRFDDFEDFVESNFDTCKWIGLLIVLAQVS